MTRVLSALLLVVAVGCGKHESAVVTAPPAKAEQPKVEPKPPEPNVNDTIPAPVAIQQPKQETLPKDMHGVPWGETVQVRRFIAGNKDVKGNRLELLDTRFINVHRRSVGDETEFVLNTFGGKNHEPNPVLPNSLITDAAGVTYIVTKHTEAIAGLRDQSVTVKKVEKKK